MLHDYNQTQKWQDKLKGILFNHQFVD
jgi:hypothetical protein